MITLIRFIILKQKEIKIKLAFYMFLDKQLKEFYKNPDGFTNKILKEVAPYIASAAHEQAVKERESKKKKSE